MLCFANVCEFCEEDGFLMIDMLNKTVENGGETSRKMSKTLGASF
jgi:hypothetical protein